MRKAKKIGILLILLGICLPTATLPFITEFHPAPDICLTANFFQNMQNMEVALGTRQQYRPGVTMVEMKNSNISIPYRYIFASGAVLACMGIAIIVLWNDKKDKLKQ